MTPASGLLRHRERVATGRGPLASVFRGPTYTGSKRLIEKQGMQSLGHIAGRGSSRSDNVFVGTRLDWSNGTALI